MDIYSLVFNSPLGMKNKVLCCFHPEQTPSAFISSEGMFHCFGCNASAHDDLGFIKKYFNLKDIKEARNIKFKFDKLDDRYKPNTKPITQEQRTYLNSIGINNTIADKYFKCKVADNSLITEHTWNGNYLGYTTFNHPSLSSYNAAMDKYKYSAYTIGGMCTPCDNLDTRSSIIICEGEKDAFTLMSQGHRTTVSKLGGASTPILPIETLRNKNVAIIYDCDETGRNGAMKDATILMTVLDCKVRVIDLGLQDKEDLNDYFMKYNHNLQDLYNLINNTGYFLIPPELLKTEVDKFYDDVRDKLSTSDIQLLVDKLNDYLSNKPQYHSDVIEEERTSDDIYFNDLTK